MTDDPANQPRAAARLKPAGELPIPARLKFFSHMNQEILLVDFSDLNDVPTVKAVAEQCRHVVASRPLSSVRTLVNVGGMWFDKEIVQIVSDLAAKNRPYVARSAVVGVTGLRQLAFNSIVMLTKRNMRMFDSREAALRWLIEAN